MMPKRLVSGIVLAVIVFGVSMLAFGVQPTKASELVGDVNGDGKVDGKDLTIAARAFDSYGPGFMYPASPSHPRWNAACDLNNDNEISAIDLALLAKNFGESTS
jgi:hypothetical protein